MKLIFAQGNPGPQFKKTRHNIGWVVIDAYADKLGATWQEKVKYHALIAEVIIDGEKVILAKPTTFYNETGSSARALIDFYKINPARDVLVLHDDLALPFGTIRVREKGSDAGNNGIKSLNSHLGDDYHRLRIGIWNSRRDRMDDADFVLSKCSLSEQKQLHKTITPHVIDLIDQFQAGSLDITSHKLS